ncbi:MAG TPA: hypothetical protein PK953_04695 [Smithellaceae bacterium]|jgi:hypothetical protein|nr:hypothetical protein [Bacillota bacterium]HQC10193.1 hypothetical protein [Smithellaceae bacterium]
MSEKTLWKVVQAGLKKDGRLALQRLEDRYSSGVPDVLFATKTKIPLCPPRVGLLELKFVPCYPKRPETPVRVPSFTPIQRAWLRLFGAASVGVFVLVQVDKDYYLFKGPFAADRLGDMTAEEMKKTASACWKKTLIFSELALALTRL